jgi:hypothetical protein
MKVSIHVGYFPNSLPRKVTAATESGFHRTATKFILATEGAGHVDCSAVQDILEKSGPSRWKPRFLPVSSEAVTLTDRCVDGNWHLMMRGFCIVPVSVAVTVAVTAVDVRRVRL